MSVYPIDDNLRDLATDAQWTAYEAYCRLGAYDKAAAELELARGTVQQHVKRLVEKALREGRVPAGYKVRDVRTSYDDAGNIKSQSVKVGESGPDDPIASIPDPKKIKFQTILRRGDHSIERYWTREQPEDVEREKAWIAFADALSAKVVPAKPIPSPGFETDDHLTAYGVGDHHMGALAWPEETRNEPYDLKISAKLLNGAVTYLASRVPATRIGVMGFLGDFTHTDGYQPFTPASKHLLDVDSRFPKIAEAAGGAMIHSIDTALLRHEQVIVVVTAGNHDPLAAMWLRIVLRAHYRNEPRVRIEMRHTWRHYYEWGSNLLGWTHGDRMKIENLPILMAAEQAQAWGRTTNRYWFTGHVHHDQEKDLTGAKVMSMRVLPPPDAYAAKLGFHTPRDMKALVFHREHGETGRFIAPAAMFQV